MIIKKKTKGDFDVFYDTEKKQNIIVPKIGTTTEGSKTTFERTYHQFLVAFGFAMGIYVFAICMYLLIFFIMIIN